MRAAPEHIHYNKIIQLVNNNKFEIIKRNELIR